ncbi:hypothetical protein GO755_00110 [Spirosoma sp. HMF4905]|uniref:Uncharacterized protein n=1 Tax=Spirosoma arboris TaxID=2682092 RepID=A0A7K1S3M1_9BACT|nr:hypothetical protein [Spirosoma arboris]MVM28414.1 hypothetical protein [Spirosoma arboris]
MIYLCLLVAFWLGYLAHILQHTLQHKSYDTQLKAMDHHYNKQLCQQAQQLTDSLHLNGELLSEKLRLQRRLRELQAQHERTLAALN